MDLENLTAGAVELAFGQLGNTVALGTYTFNANGGDIGNYDPETDTVLAGETFGRVRMLRVAASSEELVGAEVTVDDVKILIPGVDLKGKAPATSHELTCQGITYDVIKVKVLPVNTLRIVFCRAK
jgi:hypothetical protein